MPTANNDQQQPKSEPAAATNAPDNFSNDKNLMRIPLEKFLKGEGNRGVGRGYAPKATPSQDLYINEMSIPLSQSNYKIKLPKKIKKKISKEEKQFNADLRSMVSPKDKPVLNVASSNIKKNITLWDKNKIKQRKEDALKDYLMKEGFTPTDVSKVLLPGKRFAKLHNLFKATIKYNGDILRAMKDTGYAVTTQQAASRLIKSYSWHKLIDIYFPPYLLMEKGRELLDNEDWRARSDELDRIHKLRGDFVKKVEMKVSPSGDLSNSSNEELLKILEEESNIDEVDINS